MRRLIRLCALCSAAVPVALISSVACTGESSFLLPPVDAGMPSARYEVACAAWATAVCAREAECPEYVEHQWISQAQCLERSTLICEVVSSDPNVVFDEERMRDCHYSTDCSVVVRDLPIDCLPPGRSPDGATCAFHEACRSGECVDATDQGGPCATCQAATPTACDGGGCPPAPLSEVGDPCGDGTGPGVAAGRVGPPCLAPNLYCDVTQHCSAIMAVGYGAMCASPADATSLVACDGYAICDPSSGICIPPAGDGDLCDDTQGLGCLPPAQCISNRCLYPSLSYCAQ